MLLFSVLYHYKLNILEFIGQSSLDKARNLKTSFWVLGTEDQIIRQLLDSSPTG